MSYKNTHTNLKDRNAKQEYTHKITCHFKDSRDTQSLWEGIQTIMDYKPTPQICNSNSSLPNNLNSFIAQEPPQGYMLSPLLFTLLTHDCTQTHSTNHMVKFADDTTLVGLVTRDNETHYRKMGNHLTTWCRDNNLLLNVSKTKEIVVDFRRGHTKHPPLTTIVLLWKE